MRLLAAAAVAVVLCLFLGFGVDEGRLSERTGREAPAAEACGLVPPSGDTSENVPEPEPDPAVATRRCEVIVTGPQDLPVADLDVALRKEDGLWQWERTGADGCAAFERPPGDWEGRVWEESGIGFTMRGTRAEVRLPGLVPLEVCLVDGRTGLPVVGGEVGYEDFLLASTPLERVQDCFRLRFFPCPPGATIRGSLRVSAPEGLAASGKVDLDGALDPRATVLRAVVPLWPELLLRVHTVGGGLGEGVGSVSYRGGPPVTSRFEPVAEGGFVVRNIPFFRANRLDLRGEGLFTAVEGGGSVVLGDEPVASVTVRLQSVSPVELEPTDTAYIYPPKEWELSFEFWEPCTAGLDVCAIDTTGKPIPGARVAALRDRHYAATESADDFGIARFRDLQPGEWTVELREPGHVQTVARAMAVRDRNVAADLREGHPRTVTVLVRDHGAPVPFAQVRVDLGTGATYCRIVDGVQWLTLHTGVDGRLVLPGLPGDRTVTVDAGLGSRWGKAEIHAASVVVELAEAEACWIPAWLEPFLGCGTVDHVR